MLHFIIDQVGIIRAVSLLVATIAMIAYAQYSSFRETKAKSTYEWKAKPIRSFFAFAARQEVSYMRKVPWMIGGILLMTTAAVYLPQ